MKRYRFLCLFGFFFLFSYFIPIKNAHSQYLIDFVAFGDSHTAGMPTYGVKGYVDDFKNFLGLGIGDIYNAGIPGENTVQGYSRILSIINYYKPKYIVILEGANDINRGFAIGGIATRIRNMTFIAKNYGVLPIISTVPRIYNNNGIYLNSVDLLNYYLRLYSTRFNFLLVDVSKFISRELIVSSGVHLTDYGYRIMAQQFYFDIARFYFSKLTSTEKIMQIENDVINNQGLSDDEKIDIIRRVINGR